MARRKVFTKLGIGSRRGLHAVDEGRGFQGHDAVHDVADLAGPGQAAAIIANLGCTLTRTCWEQPAPTVWPPPCGYAEMRALARHELPGARYRRHLLWRYSLLWVKPAPAGR
jgi:hypothetical protein